MSITHAETGQIDGSSGHLHDVPATSLPSDHPMMELPFAAEIDGRQYQGTGVSLTGVKLTGLADPNLVGHDRLLRLSFPFEAFQLAIPVEGRITGVNPGNGEIEVTFTDPTGPHLPQLRHVLNSYIAGDVVSMGRVLGVALQPNKPSKGGKPAASGGGSALRTMGNGLLVATATLALIGGASWLVHDRFFVDHVVAPARVETAGRALTAIDAGQIDYLDTEASMGEVAFSIRSTSGETLSVAMPCDDCTAVSAGPELGATVQAGQPVLRISQADAPLILKVRVEPDQLYALAEARAIEARFADGTSITTHADEASLSSAAADTSGRPLFIDLVPQANIDAGRAGQLARLTIERDYPFANGLDGIRGAIATKFASVE
ncbi:hypothetical protein CEW88_18630 [Alloyangia pacifica]|uniref:Alginate biosynthesis protein Alg44 n=1 Tax=Alloyangia pacifica TaxID=311180 RepID=A0A2U8HIY7_9RHOB|nr:hypothetical protein [Alloyangia pacifica]AWI85708.1 hypothetical protein CEW88_18630 [Alloyangia pacifica]